MATSLLVVPEVGTTGGKAALRETLPAHLLGTLRAEISEDLLAPSTKAKKTEQFLSAYCFISSSSARDRDGIGNSEEDKFQEATPITQLSLHSLPS